jgi:hypothetical protein
VLATLLVRQSPAVFTVRQLVEVPKRAIPPARKVNKSNKAFRAWDLHIESKIQARIIAYVRISVDLPESFSIGLRYQPDSGAPSVLVRVNGDHGPHKNPDGTRFSEGSHIHFPLLEELYLTAEPGMWKGGPPHATLLGPIVIPLTEGWRIFAERVNILNTDKTLGFIAKIAQDADQLDLGF